jgi:hypothetical protein
MKWVELYLFITPLHTFVEWTVKTSPPPPFTHTYGQVSQAIYSI